MKIKKDENNLGISFGLIITIIVFVVALNILFFLSQYHCKNNLPEFIIPCSFFDKFSSCSSSCQKLNGVCFCGKGECVHFTCTPYSNFSECSCLKWEYKEQEPICLEEGFNISYGFLNLEYKFVEKDGWCTRCLSLAILEENNQSERDNYLKQYYKCKEELDVLRQQLEKTNYVCTQDSTNLQILWDAGKCEVLEWECGKEISNKENCIVGCFYSNNKEEQSYCESYFKCGCKEKNIISTKILCGETEWEIKGGKK